MMTKKDFEALAQALWDCRPSLSDDVGSAAWKRACESVADVCKASNPRFDRQKFLDACG